MGVLYVKKIVCDDTNDDDLKIQINEKAESTWSFLVFVHYVLCIAL